MHKLKYEDKEAQDAAKLRIVAPPGNGRTAEDVGKELVRLIRSGYCWNIAQLCTVFRCERQFIEDRVMPEVEKIFINPFFSQYLMDNFSLTAEERTLLIYGRYLFSESDLTAFWERNAVAGIKTVSIDIRDYLLPGYDRKEFQNVFVQAEKKGPVSKVTAKAREQVMACLNAQGKTLYEARGRREEDFVPVPLPPLPLHTTPKLQSAASLVDGSNGTIRSQSAAFREFYRRGAIHIDLLGSGTKTLWFCTHPANEPGHISVPVSVFEEVGGNVRDVL